MACVTKQRKRSVMRVSPVNSVGNAVSPIKRAANCKPGGETSGSVAFEGWKNATGFGMYGALVGFVFGGPVGAALVGGFASGIGAKTQDVNSDESSSGYPTATDEALGIIHFDY